jgi:DNA-binding LacI/PurR family transcriptional regulator
LQRAVQELGYVPDAGHRSLKVGRTFQLTLAVGRVGNPVYVTMMRAVEEVVSAAGYRLVVTTTGPDVVDEVALVRGMARGYADGLVISPLRVDEDLIKSIRECEVPVVVAGNVPAKAGRRHDPCQLPEGHPAGRRAPHVQGTHADRLRQRTCGHGAGHGPGEGLRRRDEGVQGSRRR